MHGAKELLRRQVVDGGQSDELVDGQFVLFAFEAVKPTGRDLVGLTTPFLGKAEAALLNLSQRELPVTANRAEPCTNSCQEQTFPFPPCCRRNPIVVAVVPF